MAPGDDLVARVEAVPAAVVRPLRMAVLRPGQPAESAVYPDDDGPDTVHLAAMVAGRVVATASLSRENGWRLRGMATDPSVRGQGYGRAVLRAALQEVARRGGSEVWCNARMAAVGFYRREGFEVVSEEFDVAGIGPHVVMTRQLP